MKPKKNKYAKKAKLIKGMENNFSVKIKSS